jgi:PST family polysaccharide transporter
MRETHGSLARGFWKTTSYVSLLTIPLGIGLALLARPFTIVFLSEKWIDAVPVLQGIALYAMFLSLVHNATSAYKAQGNFGVITWLSVVRLSLLFPALWWATSVMRSIVLVGWMHAVIALISAMMGLIVAARMLSLPVRELFTSIWPAMMAGIVMALVVRVILNLVGDMSSIMQLLITIPLGALSYIAILWLANRGLLLEIIERLKSAVSRRQGKYA